jgi:hypothetical protein
MANEEMPEWMIVFGVLQLVATITTVLVGGYLLISSWNSSMVDARGRLLTVIVFFGSAYCAMVFAGSYIFDAEFRRAVGQYSIPQAVALIGVPYCTKAYILVFKYEIVKYLGTMMSAKANERGSIAE